MEIRKIESNENYEKLKQLVNSTIKRHDSRNPYAYGYNYDFRTHFYEDNAGFVAENNGQVIAFMGFTMSEASSTGNLHFGFLEEGEAALYALLAKCEPAVRARGGNKLSIRTFVHFGQIRNKMITLWERMGFLADEYVWTSTNLDLRKWTIPDRLDTSNIEPVTDLHINDIHQILVEDGEKSVADLLSHQFSLQQEAGNQSRSGQLIMSLKNNDGEIVGLSYYEVVYFNKGGYEGYNAIAFGVHFRPKYVLDRLEKRRFIQVVLSSMKDLDIQRAASRVTFKDFDVFSCMAAEGFYCVTSQVHSVDLIKSLESL